MKLGEIYVWVTDKARGHHSRSKYHVYLGEAGWPINAHVFLFISKANYGDDLLISKEDYGFLTYPDSYVSCGSFVDYTDEELAAFEPRYVASLGRRHLAQLHGLIASSDVMEERHKPIVCGLLAAAL
jgi:hypothetical protein